MTDFSWHPEQLVPLTAVATLTIGFLIYLVLYLSPSVSQGLKTKYGELRGNYYWVVLTKLAGFVLLGFVPALVILFFLGQPLSDFGASTRMSPFAWGWMLGGSLLVLLVNVLQGRRPAHYAVYPLIRYPEWNPRLLIISLITSTLFIVGYEFMFRGFLLFALVPLTGPWVAIGLNVLIYALAHIHKGLGETIGSVPFGILLCWITLESGNFWAIMVMHITLSLSADLVALWANPEMGLKGNSEK